MYLLNFQKEPSLENKFLLEKKMEELSKTNLESIEEWKKWFEEINSQWRLLGEATNVIINQSRIDNLKKSIQLRDGLESLTNKN